MVTGLPVTFVSPRIWYPYVRQAVRTARIVDEGAVLAPLHVVKDGCSLSHISGAVKCRLPARNLKGSLALELRDLIHAYVGGGVPLISYDSYLFESSAFRSPATGECR